MKSQIEFTDREIQIINKISAGMTNKDIANELFISSHTVKAHLEKIYEKVSIHNRVQLIVYAFKNGYIK